MKTKTFKKALSLILSALMFVSVFTCLTLVVSTPMTASASSSDTQMLHAKATATGLKFGWRSNSSSPIAKGTKYRLSLDWENVSNAPFGSSTFGIYCYVGSWKNVFSNSTYYSEWDMSYYKLAHGYHYDIDFTLKSSLSECREFVLYFGDINNSISSYEFNAANFVLYTRDGNEQLTDTGKTFSFPVTIRGASDGAMNSYVSSYTTTDRGQLWANNSSSSYTRSFTDIPSGYFDRSEPASDLVSFSPSDGYARYDYSTNNKYFAAGNYKFTMDCKVFSGTPYIKVGGEQSGGLLSQQSNYSASYDATNYKYTVTFTFASAWGGKMGLRIGNYTDGTASSFVCANPQLYLLDGSGNPTGENLVSTFNSIYYDTSAVSAKWNRRSSGFNTASVPENYFDAASDGTLMAHFNYGNNSHFLEYNNVAAYASAGTYRLVIDLNDRGTQAPTIKMLTGTGLTTEYAGTLVSTSGYTRTYEFTGVSATQGVGLMIGNRSSSNDVDFVIKNPKLYKYENGAFAGADYLTAFNSNNYEQRSWNPGGRTGVHLGKYSPLNCNSTLLNVTAIDSDYFPASAVSTTGTAKMANVYYGASWDVFIYNDVSLPLKNGHTYQFISDVKVTSGSPTVNIYESYGNANNDINSATYTSSYTDTTSGNTRTVTFTMARTVSIVRIRIGNRSDNTDVAASFGNLRLVESGSSTNLIAGLSSDTLQTSAGNRKWQIASASNAAYYYTHEARDIPDGYFEGTAPSNMYYISGVTTAYYGLNPSIKLKASTTYRLDFDWKSYGGAYPKVEVMGYNASSDSWPSIAQTAVNPDNKVDGSYTALTSNRLPSSVMNTSRNGHYAVTFTTPADLGTGTTRNVQFLFANYITNDDYFNYGRGSMYLGNFVLKESGATGNAFLNGDLVIAKTGDIVRSDNGKFAGFALSIDKNNGSRDLYEEMRILPQPENFFTSDGAAAQKVVRVNGGNYDYFRQSLVLESSTQYKLTYRTTYTNAMSSQYIQDIDSSNGFHTVTPTSQSYSDTTRTKTVIFTTDANLRTVHNNTLLNFYLGPNASDASYDITDIKLYKWNGSATVGPNLIENGGFYFGDEATGGSAITGLYDSEGQDRPFDAIQLTGWRASGKFEQNNSIAVINYTDGSFGTYTSLQNRIHALQLIIIDRQARTYAPYEDLNLNDMVDVYDLMRTKNQQVETSTGMGAAAQAETFRSTYIDNEASNATNISALSTAGLLATAVSRTYYIDADNGNDSNAGTSPETAWKTLAKANSVTTSGSAVLFKCGCVWRAKTGTNNAALTCSAGVTYGSYGTGPKPMILGSNYNYKSRTWTETSSGSHIWYTNTQNSGSGTHTADDVGIIVYNYGALIGNMTINKADLSKVGDFWCRAPGGSDGGEGKVYVYCPSNPATYFNSIEIGQKRDICSLANNVTINNICFKYGGQHGINGSNRSNVKISNCEIGYIGGVYGEDARLGNGVQLGQSASNCTVKNCYVYECYDAGLTFQAWSGSGTFNNVVFDNNLVENCNYAIEFFGTQGETMSNIDMTNNILRGAGYGWSYDEREGYSKSEGRIGTYRTSLIRGTDAATTYSISNFNITGNTLDCSKGFLVIWWWNANGSEDNVIYSGLTVSGNTFYQSSSVDYRTLLFKNESNSHYACSTNGVREALKSFEGTSAPSKLNKSKYVFNDERVISTY